MTMKRGLRKVVSFTMAAAMALSVVITGGGTGLKQVEAASSVADVSSAINYTTILGRAVDYGIVSKEFYQNMHMETTLATTDFWNLSSNSCDPDMAGTEPVHYIIGAVNQGALYFNATAENGPMIANVETTQEVIDISDQNAKTGIYADNGFSGNGGVVKFKTQTKAAISANIDNIVGHGVDESNNLLAKGNEKGIDVESVRDTSSSKYVVDLTDEQYKGKVVYLNVAADNEDFLKKIAGTGDFEIKKHSDTVVVFNVKAATNTTLEGVKKAALASNAIEGENAEQLLFGKYNVYTVEKGLDNAIDTQTQWNGNVDQHDKDVDNEIAQKIIWNLPNASRVSLNTSAGLFLASKENVLVTLDNQAAGWIIANGKVKNNAEFHFVYQGRNASSNDDEDSELHFSLKKSFTHSYDNVKKDTTFALEAGQYKFSLYESVEGFGTVGKKVGNTVPNMDTNKVKLPDLSITSAGTYYYIIKEEASSNPPEGVSVSDGEIDIKLVVTEETVNNKTVLYAKVYSDYYLTSADKASGTAYKTNNGVDVSGFEFSLGDFYNLITSNLIVEKKVTGDYTPADGEKYYITLKDGNDVYYATDGSTVEGDDRKIAIPANGKLSFENLPSGTYTVEEVTDGTVERAGYKLTTTYAGNGVEIDGKTTPTITVTNKYEETGILTVSKTVTGDNADAENQLVEFKIKRTADNKYVKKDASGVISYVDERQATTFSVTPGTPFTISKLSSGNYVVEEIVPEYDQTKYTLNTSYSPDDGVDIDDDSTTPESIEITNDYVASKGTITVIKHITVDGKEIAYWSSDGSHILPSDITNFNDLTQGMTFSIVDGDGKTIDFNYSGMAEVTSGMPGTKSKSNDVLLGEYTVSETACPDIIYDGKTYSATTTIDGTVTSSKTVDVQNDGENYTVNIENAYTEKTDDTVALTVKKTVTPDSGTIDAKDFTFRVKNSAGEYVNKAADGTITYVDAENATDFSVNSGSTTGTEISGLAKDTYTVEEDTSAVTVGGYTWNPDDADTNPSTPTSPVDLSTDDGEVTLENCYTKDQEETVSLTVNKTVSADEGTPESRPYSFKVKNADGEYVIGAKDADKTYGSAEDATVYTVTKTDPCVITKLAKGTYTVEELTATDNVNVDGYTWNAAGADPDASTTTVSGIDMTSADGTATLINKYTKINPDEPGALIIKKNLTINGIAPTDAQLAELTGENGYSFTFTLEKKNDNTFNHSSVNVEIKNTSSNTAVVEDLPAGTYIVREYTGNMPSGFSLVGENGVEVEVVAGSTATTANTAEFTNDRTVTGSVTIEKVFSGVNALPADFKITNDFNNSVFTVANATGSGTEEAPYKWTIENVPAYKVVKFTESGFAVDGYTLTVNNTAVAAGTESVDASAPEVTPVMTEAGLTVPEVSTRFTNAYTEVPTGSVTIEKVFSGVNALPEGFQITNNFNNSVFTVADATGSGTAEAPYKWTIDNVPLGRTVKFTESGFGIDGYSLKVNNTAVASGTTNAVVTSPEVTTTGVSTRFTNAYTQLPGNLVITKTLAGATTDLGEVGDIEFTVSGPQWDEAQTITLSSDADARTAGWAQDANDSSKWIYTFTGIKAGDYEVEETAFGTNDKYAVAAGETEFEANVSSTAAGQVNVTNTYVRKNGIIHITKTLSDNVTADQAKNITFTVTDSEGTEVAQFKYSDMQATNPRGIVLGENEGILVGETYTITESNTDIETTERADGLGYVQYALNADTVLEKTATPQNEDTPVEVGFTNTYTTTETETTVKTKFSKVAAGGGDEIKDAELEITDADGNIVDKWTSDGVNKHEKELGVGTYTLTEKTAPYGYEIAEAINFEITIDGKVNIINDDGTKTAVDDKTIVMIDNAKPKHAVNISKAEIVGGAEIPNAKLELRRDSKDGALVKKWTSTTTPTEFELYEGTYVLTETLVPDEYHLQAESITFKVDADGQITVVKGGSTEENVDENTLVMIDDLGGILRITVQEEDTNRLVPGAEVKVTTVNPDGTKETKTYITDTEGKIRITNLPSSDEYSYEVISVPDGYKVTTDGKKTDVTVEKGKETKELEKIKPEDEDIAPTPDDETPTGTLIITVLDEQTKEPVPNATVEVKYPDGTIKTYTTDESGTITITKLPGGDYTVTVTKVPDGYTVTTGKSETVTVEEGKTTKHTALITTGLTKTPNKESTVTTPTPEKSTVVNTGDSMNVAPWIVVMILSLIASIVVIIRKRRLRYEY